VRIGILGGTGPAGAALAARLAAIGEEVVVGSRARERAEETCAAILAAWPDRPLKIEAGVNDEAAGADLVVVATPWEAAAVTAGGLADRLAGKVVVSMANAVVRVGTEFQPLLPGRGSIAATVQSAVPDAAVVAAFHHLPARAVAALDDPIDADVLLCADDGPARETVAALVARVPGLRPLDAGSLANAGVVEAMTAVLLQLNVRYKGRAALRLTGIEA